MDSSGPCLQKAKAKKHAQHDALVQGNFEFGEQGQWRGAEDEIGHDVDGRGDVKEGQDVDTFRVGQLKVPGTLDGMALENGD